MTAIDHTAGPTSGLPPAEPESSASDVRARLTATLLARADATSCPERRRGLLEEVILANRPVAEAVASRYRSRGTPQEDLHQVAYEGLTKAVWGFNSSLGHDLLTYAVPTIRGQLQRYFRDQGWTVRPPRRVMELQQRIIHCAEELTQQLGREPRQRELMAQLGVNAEDFSEAQTALACKRATSLDLPVGTDEDGSLGDLMPGQDFGSAASEARLVLAPVLHCLPDRYREILYLRFFEDLTQKEIGERLGVTQMQVSRLLSHILGVLHQHLTA